MPFHLSFIWFSGLHWVGTLPQHTRPHERLAIFQFYIHATEEIKKAVEINTKPSLCLVIICCQIHLDMASFQVYMWQPQVTGQALSTFLTLGWPFLTLQSREKANISFISPEILSRCIELQNPPLEWALLSIVHWAPDIALYMINMEY